MAEIEKSGLTITSLGKMNGMVAILVSHIRIEDKKLAAFLKKQ